MKSEQNHKIKKSVEASAVKESREAGAGGWEEASSCVNEKPSGKNLG